MTATLEQTQTDLLKLLGMVQQGEDVVITKEGRPVARITAVPPTHSPPDRQDWLAKLTELRQQVATGKAGLTVEQILDEDRGD